MGYNYIMRKRIIFFFLLTLSIGLFFTPRLFAQDGLSNCSNSDKNKEIACLEERISQLRQQKNTLSSQIQEMDAQVYIKTLTIQKTEQKITETEHEIETLNNRIDTLDSSLTNLSKVLIQRVVRGYKKRVFSFFDLLLNSENMSSLISTVKYQKTTQDNNQKLLIQVQEAKTNYEEQKTLRETKKKELDELVSTLENQKVALRNQQAQKRKLLADTNNDEVTYQSLLAQARAQSTAFSTFFQSTGVNSVISADGLGKGSDGNYFSQRDTRWAYKVIGGSTYDCNGHPCSVLEAGCLLSSIAMTMKKKGIDTNPLMIASNLDYFRANTALMGFNLPNGLSRQQISISDVDSQLEQGYVIAGINYGGCRSNSDHFVVLTKKDGNDYKMHDPIYGPDVSFFSKYNRICWAEVLR